MKLGSRNQLSRAILPSKSEYWCVVAIGTGGAALPDQNELVFQESRIKVARQHAAGRDCLKAICRPAPDEGRPQPRVVEIDPFPPELINARPLASQRLSQEVAGQREGKRELRTFTTEREPSAANEPIIVHRQIDKCHAQSAARFAVGHCLRVGYAKLRERVGDWQLVATELARYDHAPCLCQCAGE